MSRRSRRRRGRGAVVAVRRSSPTYFSAPRLLKRPFKFRFLSPLTKRQAARTTAAIRRDVQRGRRPPAVVVHRRTNQGPARYEPILTRPERVSLVGPLARSEQHPHKNKKLCKCSHHRSEAQRRNSRRFFTNYSGKGTSNPQSHLCEC